MTGGTDAKTHPVVVFDTDCVLCSGAVAFILRHERDDHLRFMGAWSREGIALAARHGFGKADLDETFLVVGEGGALTRSDAALAIAAHLTPPWRWLTALRIVPRPIRDAAYRVVARNRYKWFGTRRNCTMVPANARHRFLGYPPALG